MIVERSGCSIFNWLKNSPASFLYEYILPALAFWSIPPTSSLSSPKTRIRLPDWRYSNSFPGTWRFSVAQTSKHDAALNSSITFSYGRNPLNSVRSASPASFIECRMPGLTVPIKKILRFLPLSISLRRITQSFYSGKERGVKVNKNIAAFALYRFENSWIIHIFPQKNNLLYELTV